MRLYFSGMSSWRAMACSGLLLAAACSGGGGADNPPTPTPTATSTPTSASYVATPVEASSFLAQASFGADMSDIDALVARDATQWLQSEFAKPASGYLNPLLQREAAGEELPFAAASPMFWDAMIAGDDQLRQRMVFALSQILVVSDADLPTLSSAQYMDVLTRNAFGNYRDLLEDVTYSPAMGIYLTYMYNRKGDPTTGRMPDENYARELMQLFTIGLVELNMDGSVKTDGAGQTIETYDNLDIVGLAKVFTGFAPNGTAFWQKGEDAWYAPMRMYDDQHSELEKSFLDLTIPAGTGGEAMTSDGPARLGPFRMHELLGEGAHAMVDGQLVPVGRTPGSTG